MNNGFQTIQFRPDTLQFVVDDLLCMLLFAASVVYAGAEDAGFREVAVGFSIFFGLYLLLDFVSLRRKLFVLTSETLVYQRGIFNRRTDFIELYRVIDFQETHSFLQQIVGLKTVIIYSGDRTTPRLPIPGIHCREELISLIRERVEFNKTRRGVYEITNRN